MLRSGAFKSTAEAISEKLEEMLKFRAHVFAKARLMQDGVQVRILIVDYDGIWDGVGPFAICVSGCLQSVTVSAIRKFLEQVYSEIIAKREQLLEASPTFMPLPNPQIPSVDELVEKFNLPRQFSPFDLETLEDTIETIVSEVVHIKVYAHAYIGDNCIAVSLIPYDEHGNVLYWTDTNSPVFTHIFDELTPQGIVNLLRNLIEYGELDGWFAN